MHIKKYRAATVKEAFALAQAELGDDAVLLRQRTLEADGLFGLKNRAQVEITVAVDRAEVLPVSAAASSRSASLGEQIVGKGGGTAEGSDVEYDALRRELHYIRQMLHRQNVAQGRLPEPLSAWHAALTECALPSTIVNELLGQLDDVLTATALQRPDMVAAALIQRLTAQLSQSYSTIQPGKPGYPLVFMLVGPTGVGKTTTIAKLAAQYSLEKRLPIALITADTFRIGAVSQLRTYSDLIKAPLEVAYTPQELAAQVANHRDKALILVDTPGRSPTDTEQLEVLRSFVEILPAPHLQIAVAAGTQLADARRIIDRFSVIPASGLLLTKLDETDLFGPAYMLAAETELSFSYFTTGQRVPEDIEPASNETLVGRLVQLAKRTVAVPAPTVAASIAPQETRPAYGALAPTR